MLSASVSESEFVAGSCTRCAVEVFKTTSSGVSGLEWIEYFKESGWSMLEELTHYLRSDFSPTMGECSELAIIPGGHDSCKWLRSTMDIPDFRRVDSRQMEIFCSVLQHFSIDKLRELHFTEILVPYPPGKFVTYNEFLIAEIPTQGTPFITRGTHGPFYGTYADPWEQREVTDSWQECGFVLKK